MISKIEELDDEYLSKCQRIKIDHMPLSPEFLIEIILVSKNLKEVSLQNVDISYLEAEFILSTINT